MLIYEDKIDEMALTDDNFCYEQANDLVPSAKNTIQNGNMWKYFCSSSNEEDSKVLVSKLVYESVFVLISSILTDFAEVLIHQPELPGSILVDLCFDFLSLVASSQYRPILIPYFFRVFICKGAQRAKFTADRCSKRYNTNTIPIIRCTIYYFVFTSLVKNVLL